MKILRRLIVFVLLPLVVVVLVALYVVSVGFNKLEFNDDFAVKADYSHYYPEDYDFARGEFRELSHRLSLQYANVITASVNVPNVADDNLSVELCYIPAQQDSTHLLVLISGVHGVEGYVGHAVQMMFADKFLNEDLLQNTGVLLIHSVNPYGFKNTRRVTENNIDMNRNSSVSDELYQSVNEGYFKVYDLINPKGKVRRMSIENRFFFVKAINEIRKASLPVLRQAVLQGQYSFPEGLYFGGHRAEPQIEILRPVLERACAPYENILAIDLHTGYGERGKLHFFPNPLEGEQRAKMEALFEGYSIDWGDSDDFYTVTGDFVGFLNSLYPEKEFFPMLFEYGTLNSQTTMGSLKSIHIMILENQGHQHGYASARDSLRVKGDLREMYFPSSPNWRNYIIDQTVEVFDVLLPRFSAN